LDLSAEISIKQITVILNRLADLANKYNTRIFIVGGPIRDMIMTKKKSPFIEQDLDIAVENNYQDIGENLAKELDAKIIRYPQFMTMTLKLKDTSHIDIAQTREEIYPKPAVLPRVYPASIVEDLKRRDFTINAMAMEIPSSFITDPFNGRKDIKAGLIRILHKQSFIDDPTRVFRAIRFTVRTGFKIEPRTEALMKSAIKRGYLKLLSGERILYELKLIMNEKKNIDILKSLQSYSIISNLFNVKLLREFFIEQKNLPNSNLKLIHFFSVIPESLWSKYPLLKDTIVSAQCLKEFHKYRNKLAKAKRSSEIYRILKVFSKSALEALKYTEKESNRIKIENYLNKYSKVKIFTTGDMLKTLNIKPGPRYAKIMNELLYQKLDKKIKNKKDEMDYLKILINARYV
jgi:tRNA nucleotidyltransferase/poly(A) polymerase